jgi:hypothetical protein
MYIVGTTMYMLQHGSLFVTSFVFLMGLLFKVDGVSSSADVYTALSVTMLLLCVSFLLVWAAVVLHRMYAAWRPGKRGPSVSALPGDSAADSVAIETLGAASRHSTSARAKPEGTRMNPLFASGRVPVVVPAAGQRQRPVAAAAATATAAPSAKRDASSDSSGAAVPDSRGELESESPRPLAVPMHTRRAPEAEAAASLAQPLSSERARVA